ncbi:LOW QUALITY PROTEIN: hypothetical protein V2J09_011577 [Rumex salicifolius]
MLKEIIYLQIVEEDGRLLGFDKPPGLHHHLRLAPFTPPHRRRFPDAGTKAASPPPLSDKMVFPKRRKIGKRGATSLKNLIKKKGTSEKFVLEWNSKGQAVGKNRSTFMSYIAVSARTLVDINIPRWDHVPKQIKESIWTTVLDAFDVPDNKQDWVIAIAGDRWRRFKSLLSRFMYDKNGNICPNPPSIYSFINQEMWDKYITTRQSDKFKEQSEKHRELSKMNLYPYRGSRKGYVGIEEEIIRENKANTNSESPLEASSSTPAVPRSLLWKKARTDKYGNMAEPDSLSERAARGEITLYGQHDILGTALGTREHAGRVRGAGVGVTITDYFGRDVPLKNSQLVQRLNVMEEQVMALKRMVTEMQSPEGLQTSEPYEPLSVVAGSYQGFPEGWTECELASPDSGNSIVATGKVFNTYGTQPVMLHNKALESGYMKVTVIDPMVQDAPLPIPTDEAYTVFEAVGAFVAWPSNLIFRKTRELQLPSGDMDEGLSKGSESTISKTLTPAPESQSTPPNLFNQSAVDISDDYVSTKGKKDKGLSKQYKRRPKPSDTLVTTQPTPSQSNQVAVNQQQKLTSLTMKLMYRCAQRMTPDDTITIDMPPTVWLDKRNILIAKNELLHWLFQENLQVSHVSVFIKYLDNLCQECGNSQMFVFCRPQILSPDKSHAEKEEVQYIANVMKRAKGKQLYFAPYSDGKHWMLCIIHPLKDQAYWLDPAGNKAHPDVKNVVQMAIRKFYSQRRKKKPRGKTQWSEIKCPRQTNDSDSGYYILRYMQEIIERRQDFIPEEYYEDSAAPGAYEQHDIDEIREKWIEFVQSHMD